MPKIRKTALIALTMVICFLAVGGGVTYAMRQLTKQEEIELKHQMKPEVPVGERTVDMIGIFPPQFEESANSYLVMYEKEYGRGVTQVVAYKGYTLLVPPNQKGEVEKVKADIDHNLESQQKATPSSDVQSQDIQKIRDVFGVKESISYDPVIGAYVDERGFQYNFYQNELVNKQEGITPVLRQKWEERYPYLATSETIAQTVSSVITESQAKAIAGEVVTRLFNASKASELKSHVEMNPIDDYRLLVVYGDNEVNILLDKVSGDIIYYGKIK